MVYIHTYMHIIAILHNYGFIHSIFYNNVFNYAQGVYLDGSTTFIIGYYLGTMQDTITYSLNAYFLYKLLKKERANVFNKI